MPRSDLTTTLRGDCSDCVDAFGKTPIHTAIAIAPCRHLARYTEIKLPEPPSSYRMFTHILVQSVLYLFSSAPVEQSLVCIV